MPATWLVGLGAAVVLQFALLALWQRNGYWDTSDGVYLLTGREWLHGLLPYREVAAAQPPPVYLVAAGLLWIHDGLGPPRVGLAVVGLATAGLVGLAVWRLCERPGLTAIAVLVAPLLPITLHEHAQLIPETLAAPLLLGAALTCTARPQRGACAVLLALACACKLAFVLPALAIIAVSPHRGRLLMITVAVGALLAAVTLIAFGSAIWRGAVIAQLHVGRTSSHEVVGLIGQGAWNELPLVALALPALMLARRRARVVRDLPLARALAALAAAGLVLILTVVKQGSYIDVLAVAEPPLLALAVCGAGWLSEQGAAARALTALLASWLAVQSASLLLAPGAPWAATRPFAASGLRRSAAPATVDRLTRQARACPVGRAYAGAPFIAFLADRREPGNQADTFITTASPTNARFARLAAADIPTCPAR
jgi:hypothetical protein